MEPLMKTRKSYFLLAIFALAILAGPAIAAEVPTSAQIQPDVLAKILQSNASAKPLILQVGFQKLYQQAHIPGAEYVGAANDGPGIQKLEKRVSSLPKHKAIVLYCGCCPWWHCPNVQPAYELLHSMGFTNVKVLYIAQNFGADWVSKGYPTEKSE
jgi:thiosulfate/3-mercaptopyruvate sulfurtransferase